MLFDRITEIIVGQAGGDGKSIGDLRCEFDLTATSSKSPNQGTLKVYNAAPDTISMMETVNNIVIIKAGYVQDVGPIQIFAGTVCRSLTYQDGPDVITEMELRDSVIPLRDAKVSISYPPNTSAMSVLDGVAKNFGLPIRKNLKVTDKQYPSGFAFNGRVRNAMDQVCNFLGLEWSAQGNEIQIIKKGGIYSDMAVDLSAETGMIGYPRRESKTMTEKTAAKEGIKYGQKGIVRTTIDVSDPTSKLKDKTTLEVQGYRVRSLMNGALYPGAYVKLTARGINGSFFRVEEAHYVGDVDGADFYVEVLLRFV